MRHFSDLHQQLLERYAPPSILVNEEYEIVHLSTTVGRYLHVSGGEPTNNLLKLIRQELRLELRTALYQSVQRQVNVESKNYKLLIDKNQAYTGHYAFCQSLISRLAPTAGADDYLEKPFKMDELFALVSKHL